MTVDRFATPYRSVLDGKTSYFCGAGCRRRFDEDTDAYLSAKGQPATR